MTDDTSVATAPVEAVLFDFSGTLFRFTERAEWFADLHDADGAPIDVALQAELIRRMTAPTGIPADLGPDERTAWERRDLDPELHRLAYLAVLRSSGLTVPGHAESLYERVLDPQSWDPYPDTVEVVTRLHADGVGVGIVSNIAFDLRRVLARFDLDGLVGAWALSHEVGRIKPAAGIFTAALDELGVPAGRTLMVGDSDEADGGARALGCRFALVEPRPIPERPHALLDAVRAHGLLNG